ncbi:MAG: glycosyltransferase, partial [Candidatus Heimdallarchaeota archaeon]|nr:glycosyltransferase [Candidatus Heimdallarchaeota archaeon]
MIQGLLSIVIPNRNEMFLKKTVDDILSKAEGDIELIIVMDGIWVDIDEFTDIRIRMLHHGTERDSRGMRASINAGMAVAQGEYVMKIDGHCMVDKGFDVKLKAVCKDNYIVIPRRHRLDPEEWKIADGGKLPVDYMAIDYPFKTPFHHANGLHGHIWNQRYHENKDIEIDDTPSFQGSCYFMTRKHWDEVVGPLNDENYGPFSSEAQEVGFKTWFSGGRVVVNKNVWYAHLHKGKKFGRGFAFSNAQYKKHLAEIQKGQKYCIDYWMNTKDYEYDWEWFMNKFPNMPNWEKDWKGQIERDKRKLN